MPSTTTTWASPPRTWWSKYGISREAQDAFAAASQQKAAAAIEAGRFADEITPMLIPQRKGDPVAFAVDEQPRAGTTAESLAKLKPGVQERRQRHRRQRVQPQRRRRRGAADERRQGQGPAACRFWRVSPAYANAGVDPAIMGIGPVSATRRCLDKAGWSLATWT